MVRTDHRALIFLKRCKFGYGRLSRWILALQNFNIDWEHITGKSNIVPDILSRTDFEGNYEARNTNEFKIHNLIRDDKYLIRIIKKLKKFNVKTNGFVELKNIWMKEI